MKNTMKKLISILLAVMMLIPCITISFAEDGKEEKTDYWEIVNSVFTEDYEPTESDIYHMAKWNRFSFENGDALYGFRIDSDVEFLEGLPQNEEDFYAEYYKTAGLVYYTKYEDLVSKAYITLEPSADRTYIEYSDVFIDAYIHLTNAEKVYIAAKIFNSIASKEGFRGEFVSNYKSANLLSECIDDDINFDGSVNLSDIKTLKKYFLNTEVIINYIAADRDGDGEVGMKDIKSYKKFFLAQ